MVLELWLMRGFQFESLLLFISPIMVNVMNTNSSNAERTTVRMLESLIRLAQGISPSMDFPTQPSYLYDALVTLVMLQHMQD